MLSRRVVTVLLPLFSLVMMMPGKHYLVETEDSADDNNGMSVKGRDSRDYWGGPKSYAQQMKRFGIQRFGRYYGSRRPFAFFPTTTTTQRTTTTTSTTTTPPPPPPSSTAEPLHAAGPFVTVDREVESENARQPKDYDYGAGSRLNEVSLLRAFHKP